MIPNLCKCHYIAIGDNHLFHTKNLNNDEIASSNEEKLLG